MSYLPPEEALTRGAEILGRKLYPLGFKFRIVEKGKGSGGHFAVGSFVNGDREIRMWFRFELGGVSYRKADVEKGHTEFMQYLGLEGQTEYPGFHSEDPLAGFTGLLHDFERCSIFFDGDGREFHQKLRHYEYRHPPKGLAALRNHEK